MEDDLDKNNDTTIRRGGVFKEGLTRTLLLWFLAIALIPLLVMSYVSYQNANKSITDQVEQELLHVSHVKNKHLQFYFQRILTHLDEGVENPRNIELMEQLNDAFSEKQQTGLDFVKGYKWAMISDRYHQVFDNYLQAYGYYDVFFIDTSGNILFTVAEEDDLGTNLMDGKYADTRFAKAVRHTLKRGTRSFSDLEYYEPSNGELAGFISSALLDDEGNQIGALAFQFSIDAIDEIMHDFHETQTSRTYLVGLDMKLRSSLDNSGTDILVKSIDTQQTQNWKSQLNIENKSESGILYYDGPASEKVMGVYSGVDISGVQWCLIAEIDEDIAHASSDDLKMIMMSLLMVTIIMVFIASVVTASGIVNPLLGLVESAKAVEAGDLKQVIRVTAKNEIGVLAKSLSSMLNSLRTVVELGEQQDWLKTGQNKLADEMRSSKSVEELTRDVVSFVAKYVNTPMAVFYLKEEAGLRLSGGYAFSSNNKSGKLVKLGEGLLGQVALEKKTLTLSDVPKDYIKVQSSLGSATPNEITIVPVLLGSELIGVMEFCSLNSLTAQELMFLELVSENIAFAVNLAMSREESVELLAKTTKQAEILQSQQEELKASNESLEEQTLLLKESEEELKQQSEELRVSNEELSENQLTLKKKNAQVEFAKKDLEIKANELALASKYKSEFLANMSHELRTPLNSLLLLSKGLANNKKGNLTETQVEDANIIHEGGNDLLNLINDIMDLSKVEAGMLQLNIEDVKLEDVSRNIHRLFNTVAKSRGITFEVSISDELPKAFVTDAQRLEQVLKNFLSNAMKFTDKGRVSLIMRVPKEGLRYKNESLLGKPIIAFSVKDSGIGIPADKQAAIFEAFQQQDGSTSRKYGGTGLGLSISRELTRLLGGEIQLESVEGEGSTFTLYLPLEAAVDTNDSNEIKTETLVDKSEPASAKNEKPPVEEIAPVAGEAVQSTGFISDDRSVIHEGDSTILVIEDDLAFAKVMRDFVREDGSKCLVAGDGRSGILLAMEFQPDGILLDMGLPDIEGIQVLDHLKYSLKTRHIPVHIVTGRDIDPNKLGSMGALGYLKKPASEADLTLALKEIMDVSNSDLGRILVVEDDLDNQQAIRGLLEEKGISITCVETGGEAYSEIASGGYNCMILDLNLPDMTGFDVLGKVSGDFPDSLPPVIIYTAQKITADQQKMLDKYALSIVIKGSGSPERLLDDVSLFLHSVDSKFGGGRRKAIQMLHDEDAMLKDRKVLLVDDDVRNTYALSKSLAEVGLDIVMAHDGEEALEILEEDDDFELVLMDMMMPVMDGYDATRGIRKMKQYKEIPIIALTALAMPEDRDKCMNAGASEYLTKPIDLEKLLSMLRIWLFKKV